MATISDVAQKAGVSVATVSRVLNGSSRVSPETALRVRRAIAELDYRPNLLGRNLRRTKSERIQYSPMLRTHFMQRLSKG